MNQITLITGATSGIGKACAEKYAAAGHDIIITGRRKDRLEALSGTLTNQFRIRVLTLCFDVQDRTEVEIAFKSLPDDWKKIEILVNNAGLALGRDNFEEASLDDWDTMLNTNVHGLIYVSKAVVPWMIANKKGHIVNIGSVAGKEVYEKGNAYCASKFAVDAISRGMRIDLLKYRIKVTCVSPGAVVTEFSNVRFKGDEAKAISTYDGLTPLAPEDIADTIYYCTSLPAHVCINDLVITCTQQAGTYYFSKDN